ncbi:MAG: lyase family protein [Bacteroidota bacterium]|nr:lyase family protein [Bacteroidota bacterium]
MRIEKDFLGEKQIPADALYGIHSLRAKENFPDDTRFHIEWFKALGIVKSACYHTYLNYKKALQSKFSGGNIPIALIADEILYAMIASAEEISEGKHFKQFIVPAISGGAGTSINMNINEIISNLSLIKLGRKPGDYSFIDPIEHANIFQSTNDVIPSSLKVAILRLLNSLEQSVNNLRFRIEHLESTSRDSLRIAYTQMQQAVPSSYGKLLSAYNDALSRDWWRVSKCFERIKVLNLGGSAVGTGIAVPRFFIMEIVPTLQKLTDLPVARSENLSDATANLDTFVEVHAIMKSHAVNLEKMISDIRLLASDLVNNAEIQIPSRQVGSSIMPGKVNPVIPEFTISVAHKVYNNDSLISSLCALGCLDLNAYLPVIGHSIIESLKLLIAADNTLRDNLFDGLIVNSKIASDNLYKSPAITTALTPYIGYNKAALLAKEIKKNNTDIFQANRKLQLIDEEKLKTILQPQNLLKLGYSINDLTSTENP